jgi:ferrous iron transport protein B
MELKSEDFSGTCQSSYILIGNVNTGKSTIFNQLCQKDAKEGNYPGTTVTVASGHFRIKDSDYSLIDTPGLNTIYSENEDELISKQIILDSKATGIIFVADAKNLKRSLALYFHYAEYGLPTIFDINMMDEAFIRNIDINVEKLSQILQTDINTSVAIEGDGISSLKKKLDEARKAESPVRSPQFIENYLKVADRIVGDLLISRAVFLALLTNDALSWDYLRKKCDLSTFSEIENLVRQTRKQTAREMDILLIDLYMEEAEKVYNQVVWVRPTKKIPLADKLGVWSRNPLTGIPIAIVVIMAMFLFVGRFGAEFLVGIFEGDLFGEIIIPYGKKVCGLVPYEIFSRAIVGEFGLLSLGFGIAIGIVMPVLLTFYFFYGILENSGYLPRLAILLSKLFKKMGMSGKAVLPLIMGFSCITMAILTTRVLDTQKERNIATFLLILGIPCAPLLSVMLVLLAEMPLWCYVFVFGFIATQILIIGYLTNRIFAGKPSDFIMEMPVLRIPRLRGLLLNSVRRTYLFLKEAIPVFLLATFIVFILDEIGGLAAIEKLTEPVLSRFVGLPKESVNVFLMSIIRREAGVGVLTQLVERGIFNNIQIIVNLLLITFLMPCVNAILVIVKERGAKVAVAICGFVLIYAILIGALVNRTLLALQSLGII